MASGSYSQCNLCQNFPPVNFIDNKFAGILQKAFIKNIDSPAHIF